MKKTDVAIIGASGYTGSELARILSGHPRADLHAVTSETHAGKRLSELHPHLEGICDLPLISAEELEPQHAEVVFLALPHGISMSFVDRWRDRDWRIIDLSGDFRLESQAEYESWYQMKHVCPELLENAVFGLPELYREDIRSARLIANPGCYPTASILALFPLLKEKLIEPRGIFIDAKSGVSGAGAKAKAATHYPTVNDSIRPYGLATHRHTPEIRQILENVANTSLALQFTPHLTPMTRGILATVYASATKGVDNESVHRLYKETYADEPFVRVRNEPPATADVRGSNFCDVFATFDESTGHIIAMSAIDNLVKGAAGQAIQNMNLQFDYPETTGLLSAPLSP